MKKIEDEAKKQTPNGQELEIPLESRKDRINDLRDAGSYHGSVATIIIYMLNSYKITKNITFDSWLLIYKKMLKPMPFVNSYHPETPGTYLGVWSPFNKKNLPYKKTMANAFKAERLIAENDDAMLKIQQYFTPRSIYYLSEINELANCLVSIIPELPGLINASSNREPIIVLFAEGESETTPTGEKQITAISPDGCILSNSNIQSLSNQIVEEMGSVERKVNYPIDTNILSANPGSSVQRSGDTEDLSSDTHTIYFLPDTRPALIDALLPYIDPTQHESLKSLITGKETLDQRIRLNCQQVQVGKIFYDTVKDEDKSKRAFQGYKTTLASWICRNFVAKAQGQQKILSESVILNYLKNKGFAKSK